MRDALLSSDDHLLATLARDVRETQELLTAALDLASATLKEVRIITARYERLLEDFRALHDAAAPRL